MGRYNHFHGSLYIQTEYRPFADDVFLARIQVDHVDPSRVGFASGMQLGRDVQYGRCGSSNLFDQSGPNCAGWLGLRVEQ